jgi:hypothetical protein
VCAACLPWRPRRVLRPRAGSSAPLDVHTVGSDLTVLQHRIASSGTGHSHAPDAARDTLPYVFFENFLAASACAHLTHPALPHFVSVCYVTAGTFTRLGLCRLPYDKALVSRVLSISHDE